MYEPRLPLKERAFVWWEDVPVLPGDFAPQEGVFGRIEINEEGFTSIELDEPMPGKDHPFAQAIKRDDDGRNICGKFTVEGLYFTILNVYRASSTGNSGSFSTEVWTSTRCLMQRPVFNVKEYKFDHLSFPLFGFEEWLGLGQLALKYQSANEIEINIKQREIERYELDDGVFTLRYIIATIRDEGTGIGVRVSEEAYVDYHFNTSTEIDNLIEFQHRFEDLLVLLTNQERKIGWPTIRFSGSDGDCWLFYQRSIRKDEEVFRHRCWVTYPKVRNIFTEILMRWKNNFDQAKPVFYLYAGTRRGPAMYVENQFLNLIFGLEALHRLLVPDASNVALKEKVKRILESIAPVMLRSNDRRWLSQQLLGRTEPILQERLKDLVKNCLQILLMLL